MENSPSLVRQHCECRMGYLWKWLWTNRKPLIIFLTPLCFLLLPLLVPTKEASCAFVIITMVFFWCTEALPLAVTALFPVLLFPMMGIMSTTLVCSQYLQDTNMVFIGGLLVAITVEKWNLHKRIALRVLLIVGVKPALLLLGFMAVTAFLAMWMSNTTATCMTIPIAQAVLEQLYTSEERLEDNTDKSGNGTIVIEPEDDTWRKERQNRRLEKHLKLCKCMSLSVCYSASIGGIATLTGTRSNIVLKRKMNELFPQNNNIINFASWFGFTFPIMIVLLVLCWIWLQIMFLGVKVKKNFDSDLMLEEKENDIRVFQVISREHKKLGSMSFAEISSLVLFFLLVLLLLTREPGFMPGWAAVIFNHRGKEYIIDATVAIFVSLMMFFFPAELPSLSYQNTEQTEGKKPKIYVPPPLLDWNTVNEKMPWNIVILLGGGYALGKGTEAKAIHMNPLYVMLPCQLSASMAFMLPVSTSPNAIVFSYGQLKVVDMAKAGFLMNVIGVLTITLAMNTWGFYMFDLGTFPSWANTTSLP
ncbi:solute carrier family 13 member 2-like isoform X2 [Ascaphus truei]|uniref:solute carrier family 13 member 2-like isoform X2 n=1 Tax=Ascaphus truei TaxID=8439 RepID=UPI003F591B4E